MPFLRSTRYLLSSLLIFGNIAIPTRAAFINFDNCLPTAITGSDPLLLQFTPLHVSAKFNTTDAAHNLNITIYGNISGRATDEPYPPPNSPSWSIPADTVGKIPNVTDNTYTTLLAEFNVLSYTSWNAPASPFCEHVVNQACPLPPAFFVNQTDVSKLPGFTLAHNMGSSYAFATISPTFHVKSGDQAGSILACVSANVTPDLGQSLKSLLRFLPLVVLVSVGFATIIAAINSPWGTTDIFRWSSNYGRDEDVLRLVTPGFADCLGYIQFILLTGSLSLNYPGYYQPVISQIGWSALMFNQSFVTHGNGSASVVDGIYTVNGTFGLDRTSQLIGITSVKDLWAGMMVWLLGIIIVVILVVQFGFMLRWVLRTVSKKQEEDLRAKNMPFTMGNVVRIVFNFFLLPITSLTMFQLVIASKGPAYTVALAVVVLVILVLFAGWIMILIARTPRRSYLFDDLSTVLLYGPLYNTYSDGAATFALIPLFINFVRGIGIGAVQPSGVAQLVLLAGSEVVLVLTLNAFRPFPSPTSMNMYQTFFSLIRLATLLLSIAFIPSLGLTQATIGWIGYIVLLIHGAVLVFGFFLNALSTLVEVVARLAGAGGEAGASGGAARGGFTKVFGVRQLSRRVPRRDTNTRHSMASSAAMIVPEQDQKSIQNELAGGRVRSLSASSGQLLNRSDGRGSIAYDAASAGMGHSRGSGSGQFTPTTPGGGSTRTSGVARNRTSLSPGGIIGLKQAEAADPYYRTPRQRRDTIEPISPAEQSRGSWVSGDWAKRVSIIQEFEAVSEDDAGEGPSAAEPVVPNSVQPISQADELDDTANDLTRTKTDYAVREVDFYYGVRGPALSSGTRKLKTGPADPNGPVSSATGWFRGLLGGKTKDKGKGFEVVRSSRVPPPGLMRPVDGPPGSPEPYKDEPDTPRQAETDLGEASREIKEPDSDVDFDEPDSDADSDFDQRPESRVSPLPPSLPAIDTGGGIELPSRIGSKASHVSRKESVKRPPAIPRKSSRRGSSADMTKSGFPAARLSTVAASPPPSPQAPRRLYNPDSPFQRHLAPSTSQRLPFGPGSNTSPAKTPTSLGDSTANSSLIQLAGEENTDPSSGQHGGHPPSALGQLAPDIRGDRPSNMGYVAQHRAGENLHEASPDSPQFMESQAEFVNDSSLPGSRAS